MKYLNNMPGFGRAFLVPVGERGNTRINMAKASIYAECFWIRNCQDHGTGIFAGIVDNDLIHTDLHGLKYNEVVSFRPNCQVTTRTRIFSQPDYGVMRKPSWKEDFFYYLIAFIFLAGIALAGFVLFRLFQIIL